MAELLMTSLAKCLGEKGLIWGFSERRPQCGYQTCRRRGAREVAYHPPGSSACFCYSARSGSLLAAHAGGGARRAGGYFPVVSGFSFLALSALLTVQTIL